MPRVPRPQSVLRTSRYGLLDSHTWHRRPRRVPAGVSLYLRCRSRFDPLLTDRAVIAQDGTVSATEIIHTLRRELPQALIALDFDGTLAPIVTDPSASRPAPGALETLTALAEQGAIIAILTGRDVRTVLELSGFEAVPGVLVEGLYGAETWHLGALHAADELPAIGQLRARLPATVSAHAVHAGLWIEDKRLSLVVHARRAAEPGAAIEAIRAPVEALARELGLETHDGRDVLEIRMPGYDKGTVLRRLAVRYEPTAVLFGGDDLGDLPAFAAIGELRAQGRHAWGIAASSAEVVPAVGSAADLLVDGPGGMVAFLSRLVTGEP